MVKEITLTKGKVTLVDDVDHDWLLQWKWHYENGYARSFKKVNGRPRQIKMHRMIMEHYQHDLAGFEVDHKDGNGLNNQKSNLRIATRSQNAQNKKRARNNTSGYKGVSRLPYGRWISYITVDHQRFTIGIYDAPEDAARAYNECAKILHGEFARLNVIFADVACPCSENIKMDGYRVCYECHQARLVMPHLFEGFQPDNLPPTIDNQESE